MQNEAIRTYISSSEFNRCKRNGLSLFEPRQLWIDVLSYTWLTRKLRRKIGHLFQMDILPTLPRKPLIGIADFSKLPVIEFDFPAKSLMHDELQKIIAKQMMDAEDLFIIKGLGT